MTDPFQHPAYDFDDPAVDEHGQYVLDLGPLDYHERGHAPTDAGYTTSSLTENWYTAPEIVEAVRTLYGGTIDLDPMSCAEANEVVRAERIYTAADDGLAREWHGRMMLNPPWANSKRAVEKLFAERAAGRVIGCVCVLNANAMTTRWFAPLLRYTLCVPSYRMRNYPSRAQAALGKGSAPVSGTVMVFVPGIEHTPFGDVPNGASLGLTIRFAEIFSDLGTILAMYRPPTAAADARAGEEHDGA
jgi:hypothetical protein